MCCSPSHSHLTKIQICGLRVGHIMSYLIILLLQPIPISVVSLKHVLFITRRVHVDNFKCTNISPNAVFSLVKSDDVNSIRDIVKFNAGCKYTISLLENFTSYKYLCKHSHGRVHPKKMNRQQVAKFHDESMSSYLHTSCMLCGEC